MVLVLKIFSFKIIEVGHFMINKVIKFNQIPIMIMKTLFKSRVNKQWYVSQLYTIYTLHMMMMMIIMVKFNYRNFIPVQKETKINNFSVVVCIKCIVGLNYDASAEMHTKLFLLQIIIIILIMILLKKSIHKLAKGYYIYNVRK